MFSGFDYGTSNCAIGVSDNESTVKLLSLEQGQAFIPSTLYAFERELICEFVAQQIKNETLKNQYINTRQARLIQAQRMRHEHDIRADEQILFFGHQAFEQYMEMPTEGYFIKSPKSFLGASGLRPEFVQFFEDIVTAMMQNIKSKADTALGEEITQTVIGRPVNFQGLNSEKSNQQAIEILSCAAKRAGFKEVEFLFEPIAAGLDFEAKLTDDRTVLVVDIGGGTSDCAMVRMGPDYRDNAERKSDFLGHTGERIGGNDLDIQLAGKQLMPLFGMRSTLNNGRPMPTQTFWDAVTTNDAGAQADYNSQATSTLLQQLILETGEPEKLKRFIKLRHSKENHRIVRLAETIKIALSDVDRQLTSMDHYEAGLESNITQDQLADAINAPLEKMTKLMKEAVAQAGTRPDIIYITGGSAKSKVLQQAIKQTFGDIKIVDGDHFGSVAAGLTRWAKKIYS